MARKWLLICFAFAALLAIAAIVIWRMSYVRPVWYAPPDVRDEAVVALADRVEYRLVQESQRIRPEDETWTLRIREEQINAWLAARLRQWLAHEGREWPAALGTPQIRIEPQAVSIALPIGDRDQPRYLVAQFAPHIVNGQMQIALERVQFGRVSLPGEPVANIVKTLSNAAPDSLQLPPIRDAIERLQQRENMAPEFELADGRRVQLIDVALRSGAIDVTARTIAER